MITIPKIDHIYVICSQEFEPDKYTKWKGWQAHNKIDDNYITYYCWKWGTQMTDEDMATNSLDDGTLVKLFPFRKPFPLKKSEVSLGVSFLNIFKECISKNYQNILLFESDAILHPNFITLINSYITELFTTYSNWHMVSLGCGMNKHIDKIKKNKKIYTAKDIRCTDSFIINIRCMKLLVEKIPVIKLPIDEHMMLLIKSSTLIILWVEPTLVLQGSQIGLNPTTIRMSNAVFVNTSDYDWFKDVIFK